MPSNTAKKAAGTYIEDSLWNLPTVKAWLTRECRDGGLSWFVRRFCESQSEKLEQSLVVVETVMDECIQCRIPCRCFDHEAAEPFDLDVRFDLNPQTGACRRH